MSRQVFFISSSLHDHHDPQSFYLVSLRPTNSSANENSTRPRPVSSKTQSIEYLDGLRGMASLIVSNFHWIHISYPSTNWSYGQQDNTSPWLLPFVRVLYSVCCGGLPVLRHIRFRANPPLHLKNVRSGIRHALYKSCIPGLSTGHPSPFFLLSYQRYCYRF